MIDLDLPGSTSTPAIRSNWQAGVLAMQGDSYPENSYELFGPVIGWVERYLAEAGRPLRIELELLYLNTSSIKAMMDIFDMLQDAHQTGCGVVVHWRYDRRNERVAELADEFREDLDFPFEIVPFDA